MGGVWLNRIETAMMIEILTIEINKSKSATRTQILRELLDKVERSRQARR